MRAISARDIGAHCRIAAHTVRKFNSRTVAAVAGPVAAQEG
jgi:hypothetical protein